MPMMKQILVGMLWVGTFAMPVAFGAGVGDGAGGGGGRISLASGYSPGAFSVSAFSEKSGAIGNVLKYYLLAGATKSTAGERSYYEIEGQNSSAIIEAPGSDPTDPEYFQLNFELPYQDLLQTRSGFTDKGGSTLLEFSGTLADELYLGMTKSDLAPVGTTLDDKGNTIGNIYFDHGIGCQKGVRGILCDLQVGNI